MNGKQKGFCQRSSLVLGMTAMLLSLLAHQPATVAAGQVMWKYRIFQGSVRTEDLTALAETGEAPRRLNRLLGRTGQKQDQVRQILTEPISVNLVTLDRLLNSPVGDVILGQLSNYIHSPGRTADLPAMRSALVASAAQDNQISLIEVIQNYPTGAIVVEGDRLADAANTLKRLQGGITNILGDFQLF